VISEGPDPARTCDRSIVLGCAIDRLDMAGTLERCRTSIKERRYTQHVSINAAKLVALRKQPELREVIERCQLVSVDGQSVVWASRLLGDPLPERVAGIDLMNELIAMAEEHGYRIFILGASADVLRTAVERLRERHPKLVIAGFRDGYFADGESPKIAAEIRATRSDILFVAMSSPRKEQWLGEYGLTLDVPLVMGVGGAIDVVAGLKKRAPRGWQWIGMEWLYRLLQEPRRLARRYILTNAQFILLVLNGIVRRVWRRTG
jgi:N-acetylglucosaminyldiphosphoundecaprenol N-acetyl-beta-D-mannosaminyltransferase